MKFNKILIAFAAVALSVASSCSDDDAVNTPLSTTAGASGDATYNSLTFRWDKVAGTTQYGYELTDNEGVLVVRDVTKMNSVRFSNLKPATEYSLKVWSYAAFGSGYASSEPIVLKGTTKSVTKLATPVLAFSDFISEYEVSWDAVEGAEAYNYSLSNESGIVDSGSVESCSLTFSDLDNGAYTVIVTATSSSEEYLDSDPASVEFTVSVTESWRVSGTYTSAILGKSWDAVLVAYSNNAYKLLGWYGVEGYNLDFSINDSDPDDSFLLSEAYEYESTSGCYKVPTGRTDEKSVYVYPWYNYCSLSGDKNEGAINLCVFGASDYVNDTFVWSGASTSAPADDFVGTWNVSISGTSMINDNWSEEDFSYDYTLEITKVNDNTVSMEALYFSDDQINLKIDMNNKTLTVDPTTVWDYYTFAGSYSAETPVVAHIQDDGSIVFEEWCAWYNGFTYVYGTTAKLWK